MRSLLLVRHGESVWNAEGRIQGQRCAGLSARGRDQARQVASSLARRYATAAVISSDLPRALQTAAPIAAALGVEVRDEVRLRERSFGDWEGRPRDEVRTTDADRWRRWLDGQDVVAEVGGEPADALAARAVEVFRELLRATPEDGATVVVSHGGTIWHGLHALLELPVPTLGGVANASVAVAVAYGQGDGVLLDRWNEVSHLDTDVRPSAAVRRVSDVPPVGR